MVSVCDLVVLSLCLSCVILALRNVSSRLSRKRAKCFLCL